MYKVKIVFLYVDSKGKNQWSPLWVDWNGVDDLSDVVLGYKEIEENEIKRNNIDTKLPYVVIAETCECSDGDYRCESCENYFNKLDDGSCPYCGSNNCTESRIEDKNGNEDEE